MNLWKLSPAASHCTAVGFFVLVVIGGCEENNKNADAWECQSEEGESPEYLENIGCVADFQALASQPMNSSLPGAMTVKTVVDRLDENHLYFQNSVQYSIHYEFASAHLSGVDDLPLVTTQDQFTSNYYEIQRRFLLGAVTFYEGPQKWVYEISPYDKASAAYIEEAYMKIVASAYFGEELYFHPTGQAVEAVAVTLPENVKVITTDELYEGTDYQALNLAEKCGQLVFVTSAQLETAYVGFRDIVVLDEVPNDISVVQGIITEAFQTPLSHVNVLSQNRGTPNMGLRGAFEDNELRALEGKWVRFNVGAFEYRISEITKAEADECYEPPTPIEITDMNLEVTELTDVQDIVDPESDIPLREQISAAIPAFGGKGSHYGALSWVEEANAPKAFVIPVYYYNQFMEENGFNDRVDTLLADQTFVDDAATRDDMLKSLRTDMKQATVNEEFLASLEAKLTAEFADTRMRFRSSTNAEDLGDFTGAGLYTSKSGQVGDLSDPVEDAIREVWASIWFFRAFEERSYRGISHKKVGMALLVHRSFPDEEANGVAATSNPFDMSGNEPAFYVNVQLGEESVVQPDAGVTTDQYFHYFNMQDQPVSYIEHSSLVPEGETVLTNQQIYDLGVALNAIHTFFYSSYGPDNGSNEWYAMDVEFKFDGEPGEEPELFVKQARPYPGRSGS